MENTHTISHRPIGTLVYLLFSQKSQTPSTHVQHSQTYTQRINLFYRIWFNMIYHTWMLFLFMWYLAVCVWLCILNPQSMLMHIYNLSLVSTDTLISVLDEYMHTDMQVSESKWKYSAFVVTLRMHCSTEHLGQENSQPYIASTGLVYCKATASTHFSQLDLPLWHFRPEVKKNCILFSQSEKDLKPGLLFHLKVGKKLAF